MRTIMVLLFWVGILAMVMGVLLVTMVVYISSIPIVQFSNTTGECIQVIAPIGGYNCNRLPEKYYPEWVK